jgi:hypothetical protein
MQFKIGCLYNLIQCIGSICGCKNKNLLIIIPYTLKWDKNLSLSLWQSSYQLTWDEA